MSNDLSLDEADKKYLEACAVEIATRAAKLVASHDMGRNEAIAGVVEEMRQESAAADDVTGVLGTMIDVTNPSKVISQSQLNAVREELLPAARIAARTL